MMDESDIRRRFARLREADQERAPSFARIYERAHAHRPPRATLRARTLVVGAAAMVAIATVWLARTRSVTSELTPTIMTWSAPTDVLLRTPGRELLGVMPALGASVLDAMIPTSSIKGGA
jgi:hypothetical protein